MPIMLFGFIGTIMLTMVLFQIAGTRHDQSIALPDAQAEFTRYRDFAWAAQEYVKATPFEGDVKTKKSWETIKPSAPDYMQGITVPGGWYIEGTASGWVICSDISPEVRLLVSRRLPEKDKVIRAQDNQILIGEMGDELLSMCQ